MSPNPRDAGAILHVDMDAFYAAIELRDQPELRGKPVVVGSQPDERGVVSTASYEARRFGIHSAMPSRTAGKLCPHAIFLPVRMGRYLAVSEQVMDILHSFTPLVEQVSVDEAFLDVRGALRAWRDSVRLAHVIKERIAGYLGLTASVGVGPNKFLAKFASDLEKPDGLTVTPVIESEIADFLAPLPVGRLWGVGHVSEQRLSAGGIHTIGDIQTHPLTSLEALAGKAMSRHLHQLSFGRDEREVVTEHEAKSISSEHTFAEDCSDREAVRAVMISLAEAVGRRLRRSGQTARVGQIKYRFDDFRTVTRRRSLRATTDTDRDLLACALELLEAQTSARPVRLVGFGVLHLSGAATGPEQQSLFEEDTRASPQARDQRLDQAVDSVRERYGRDAVTRGTRSRSRTESDDEA